MGARKVGRSRFPNVSCVIWPSPVGARLEERGMLPLLQDGLRRVSLNDYRLGQILDALFGANLNRVFGAIALNALDVYTIAPPWLHQDTTTITLYGAYEEEARPVNGLVPPRPAYGHSKDGRDDLKQTSPRFPLHIWGSNWIWAHKGNMPVLMPWPRLQRAAIAEWVQARGGDRAGSAGDTAPRTFVASRG